MKTIKPYKLGMLTRPFEFERRLYLGVSVLAFAPLGEERALYSEASLWKFVADELAEGQTLDAGIPKTGAEFLLSGYACAPGGNPAPSCAVRARVGGLEKTLYVFGDRYWDGANPTDPHPFVRMPLDWTRSFGAEDYSHNPLGKGAAAIDLDGMRVHPLANIEHPERRVTSASQQHEPANFGPVDIAWPQRTELAGTYDEAWLADGFPGLASDADWHIHNFAQPDQWFDEPLRGDEDYLFDNLHPDHPQIAGKLPGIAARCFITRADKEPGTLEEVRMRLATSWFFPHAERVVLVFQGMVEVSEEDAADIAQIVIAGEWLGQPKEDAHYHDAIARRLDPEKGFINALRDSELLPEGMPSTVVEVEDEEKLIGSEGLLRRNLRTRAEIHRESIRQTLIEQGIDPEGRLPPPMPEEEPLPPLEEVPDFLERVNAEAEAQKKEMEQRQAEADEKLRALCEENDTDFEEIVARSKEKPTGPPKFRASEQIEAIRKQLTSAREQGTPIPELEEMAADPRYLAVLDQLESATRDGYRRLAHHQDPVSAMEREEAAALREEVQAAHAGRHSLAGRDLTGANLGGLDLRGADLQGALLEHADLGAADLSGANLINAVMAHAKLVRTNLSGARLVGANLGAADLRGITCDEHTDFSDAILERSDLTQASLRGARLVRVSLSEARFGDTDCTGIHAPGTHFIESDLRGLRLSRAHLDECIFIKNDVTDVDFSGASLRAATFLGAKGHGARFRQADCEGIRFVDGCSFEAADFAGAILNRANLRGCGLAEADLRQAQLNGADLSGADLRKANLYRAVARESLLLKTQLSEAVLVSANLMNALLGNADLRSTDLRDSNLFGADLARVIADTRTNFEGALMTRARINPQRTAQ